MNESKFLPGSKRLFQYYKGLADKSISQITDEQINWRPNDASNSVALIVHHMTGNMLSRFTDFLTSDGEKTWRNRDAEFEVGYASKSEMLHAWEEGWTKVFEAIEPLTDEDLNKIVYIRNEGHTVMDAIQRQIAHYSYHIGQIVFIAKSLVGEKFETLTIAKGGSATFNTEKFSQEKAERHFADKPPSTNSPK